MEQYLRLAILIELLIIAGITLWQETHLSPEEKAERQAQIEKECEENESGLPDYMIW